MIPSDIIENAIFIKHRCSTPIGQSGPLFAAAKAVAEYVIDTARTEKAAAETSAKPLTGDRLRSFGWRTIDDGETFHCHTPDGNSAVMRWHAASGALSVLHPYFEKSNATLGDLAAIAAVFGLPYRKAKK